MKSPITGKYTIPPQQSAQDTSNWDSRTFITPQDGREVVAHRAETALQHIQIINPYIEQEERKAAKRSKKSSK